MTQPLQTLHYVLTANDVFAHAHLPGEMRGWRKLAFFLWLALAGVVLALLPENWTGGEADWRFWALGAVLLLAFYSAAVVFMTTVKFLKARRLYPAPVEVTLELWPDHLVLTQNGKKRTVALKTIAAHGQFPTHAYLALAANDIIIIPRRAFADAADIAAFLTVIDGFGRDDEVSTPKPSVPPGSAG